MSGQLRAAVLGYPIAHSLSPRIHTHWIRHFGLRGDYTALAVPPTRAELERTLAELSESGYDGCNLTVPLKELVLQLPQYRSSAQVRRIGAANTVCFRQPDMLVNTDVAGVAQSLAAMGAVVARGSRILILGAGGAARAAVAWAHSAGAHVTLANRTEAKARQLAQSMHVQADTLALYDGVALQQAYAGHDILIQSTSAELDAQTDITPLLPTVSLTGKYCLDMVYKKVPVDTRMPAVSTYWSRAAAAQGAQTEDGLRMLVAQAAESFALWTGCRPDVPRTLSWLRASLESSATL